MDRVLGIRNHALSAISDDDDIEWFGFDLYAPTPQNDKLSTIEDHILVQLRNNNTNHLRYSDSFGIDLYQEIL